MVASRTVLRCPQACCKSAKPSLPSLASWHSSHLWSQSRVLLETRCTTVGSDIVPHKQGNTHLYTWVQLLAQFACKRQTKFCRWRSRCKILLFTYLEEEQRAKNEHNWARQGQKEGTNNIYVCGFFASRRRRHWKWGPSARPPKFYIFYGPKSVKGVQVWLHGLGLGRLGHRLTIRKCVIYTFTMVASVHRQFLAFPPSTWIQMGLKRVHAWLVAC